MVKFSQEQLQGEHAATNGSAVTIGKNQRLALHDAHTIACATTQVRLDPQAQAAMLSSYQFLQSCVNQRLPIYGINTQFGDQVKFLDRNIKNIDENQYQTSINARQINLIRSHACGLGDTVPISVVRVAMALRMHCLAQGYSGVRPQLITDTLALLNAGIIPLVRQYGSIGASGDLIPLAMIAAGLTGEAVAVHYHGEIMPAPAALAKAGLPKVEPHLREGLALINGTSFMTAIASLTVYRLKQLFQQILTAVAMCLEAMMVITSGYHPLVHQLKNHSGQTQVNAFLLNFWQGSQLLTDLDQLRYESTASAALAEETQRAMQDYYSLRAVPQGFGTFAENLERATIWIENEMNSVNDNPIIDPANKHIHHGANFMGYYITDACDMLKMNIAQASTWLHALLANLVHPRKNTNLPANLVTEPWIQNGFRPLQILAAAIAVQNRKLAQSHQAYTLPTEGDNQDVNSLGTHAAFDLQQAVTHLAQLTAITLLAAAQALELRGITQASKNAQAMHQIVREYSPKIADCRPLSIEIDTIVNLLHEGKFIPA